MSTTSFLLSVLTHYFSDRVKQSDGFVCVRRTTFARNELLTYVAGMVVYVYPITINRRVILTCAQKPTVSQ